MATAKAAKTLQDEATCPICLEYFNDPVSLDCNHDFCRACITRCWKEFDADISCPQCRKTFPQMNLKPNRKLKSIVEAARELSLESGREPETERLCEKHREPLKLFCKEDEIPICLVCDRAKEHRDHTVVPAEEAVEEFQEKIQAHLKKLREEREKLVKFQASKKKRSQENLRKTKTERQKIVSEFQQLRGFLEEQEQLLLAQLLKLDEEILKIQTENMNKLSVEMSRLTELISDIEGKYQKPASEFLQDIRSTLSRCEKGKFQQPEEISPELEKGLGDFSQKTVALIETVRKFKDTLPSAPETKGRESLGLLRLANVTLDPDTAHPNLFVSADGKSVRWAGTQQDLPENPQRFDSELCVLGCGGFTSGRHCWEVEVGDGRCWAVGLAREFVRRKGRIHPNPAVGIWAVELWGDHFQALTSPATPLPLRWVPSRIRVCLDCDRGQVTFFHAGDQAPIFTFPLASVPGGRIRPWLRVGPGSQLRLCP
ncbi:zinc finger protein RFP-like isoform X2 [Emydura macquarii macquarii]|uniref:zinc finger protein RFP-like isoform X2 n=1 Tax=Emydura macquarii macquarii TaxID=1129001 RepID=UPI003529EFAF